MSSHREAPGTSQDPVVDSTDVYAFVSPDKPDTVTLICNYIPFETPAGGPNFYEFGDDVLYSLHISNRGTAQPDITYEFEFQTSIHDPTTFLYNTGPITSLTSPNYNKRQTYTVTRVDAGPSLNPAPGGGGGTTTLLTPRPLACPPCNIGPNSTPNYPALAADAVYGLSGGVKVFAGQRADGFYIDLGAVFDLADLRPFQELNVFNRTPAAPGVDATQALNVHSIAIQVPISAVTVAGHPVIGVWATASRRKVTMRGAANVDSGPWVQVSRLGNPLFNEVLVPIPEKDAWNAGSPAQDSAYASGVAHPELAKKLPVIYPGVFPNLDALTNSGAARADLEAILLTGLPTGVVAGFTNYTGAVQADMLRLNTSIPPTPSNSPSYSIYGVPAGDHAGFPNGRRVSDDVFAIELRAIAGATYSLVDKTYTPDAAASLVTDGLTPSSVPAPYLSAFPYLGVPYSGYHTPGS